MDYMMFYLLGAWSGSCLTLAAIVLFRSEKKREPEERFTFKPMGHVHLPEIPPPMDEMPNTARRMSHGEIVQMQVERDNENKNKINN